MSDELRPIVIKRKKVVAGGGHHGGAWKVAYADFVTAMMAFFLLMWLLNATTEEQRKGIADYFNPNIPMAAVSGGGADALSGDSIRAQKRLAKDGIGAKTTSTKQGKAEGEEEKKETEAKIEELNKALAAEGAGLLEHVSLKKTSEGLVIELIDSNDQPLFDIGNGELSSDRANTARRLLLEYGFPAYQILEVSGKAATEPLSDDPMAAQNRRISIILLRGKAAPNPAI